MIAQHSSASVQHFTPSPIIEAARATMGGIDLDPASCALAQEVVKADRWYGPGSPQYPDGLIYRWDGCVFLNPPGGRVTRTDMPWKTKSRAALWWAKLATEWANGNVSQAIFLGFSLEILRSTQSLDVPQPLQFPICVPKSRIRFDTIQGPITCSRKFGYRKFCPNIATKIDRGKYPVCDEHVEYANPEPLENVTEPTRVGSSSPTNANVIVYLPPIPVEQRSGVGTFSVEGFALNFAEIGEVRV